MDLYVQAKSKKEINEKLSKGNKVYGENYSMFGGGGSYCLNELNEKATIKVFSKYVNGSPYAKAYGTFDPKKNKVL